MSNIKERELDANGNLIEKMTRVISSVGKPQFKGSGFYETDYKEKPK